jgi:hypothetical protein
MYEQRENPLEGIQQHTRWNKKHWKTKIAMGGWCCSRHANTRGLELEESRPQQRQMGKTPQEGQGPPSVVEPMMMMSTKLG